jgi:LuxR family maltose regulon positive regulatory protein
VRFRYVAPFRGMLHDELRTRHPDLVRQLHRQAAEWYAEHGRYAESLEHAGAAGSWGYAAEVAIGRIGVARLLTAPDAEHCRAALMRLPEYEAAPAAQVLRPILALLNGDLPAARTAARTAAHTLRRLDACPAALLLTMRVIQVVLGRYSGDLTTAATAAADVEALRGQLAPAEVPDDADLHALVLSNLGVVCFWSGQVQEARSALGRAAAATGPSAAYMVHDALGHLAMLQLYDGTLIEADAYARQSLAIADQAGLPARARVGAASVALAATALIRNDLAAVREHLARAAATTGARHDPATATATALIRARSAIGRLDGRRALVALEAAGEYARRWHASPEVTDAIALMAVEAHLIDGDTGAARRCLESVSDSPERIFAWGRLMAAEGDEIGARRTFADLYRSDGPPCLMQETALSIGRLAFADGDTATAARALRDALDHGRPEQRRRPIVDSGDWVHQLLRRHPDIAAGHGWLGGDRGGDPGIAPTIEPLTERELEVLGRLADALSTEDIADDLYLSVNTIKTHLKSIYRKLGAADRSAAARRARELNLLPSRHREPPAP